ncbi:hypothetical protein ACU4GI_13125 [Cupriavidus basilensis]
MSMRWKKTDCGAWPAVLARESMRGVWIVAREYKDRVEVGCEYPNPRLGGQKRAAAR